MPNRSHVLLVEDGLLLRFVMAEMLSDKGFIVTAAGDASEAIAALEADSSVDIMVTDIEMPGDMDGVGLAAEAKSRWPDLPIIIISGQEDMPVENMPPGCPFLPKPVPDRLLVAMIRKMIASGRAK